MREVRWQGAAAVTPRRLWDRMEQASPVGAWPIVAVLVFGPLVIGAPLGITPDLVEVLDDGESLEHLNGIYDGLLVGYLAAMALLVGLATLLWQAHRRWRAPRPYGVRPDFRAVGVAAALWLGLAAGAVSLPVGPKSERTVIIPPSTGQAGVARP